MTCSNSPTKGFPPSCGKSSLDAISFGLGWLRFTCDVFYFEEVTSWLSKEFGTKFLDRKKGWQGYIQSWTAMHGILIGSTPRLTQSERESLGVKQSPNEGKMTVDIPQSALDSRNLNFHWMLWLRLAGIQGIKFSRIDVYVDDYSKAVSPSALRDSLLNGSTSVPRVEQVKFWAKESLRDGKSLGETVYLGSEKSQKQVRYYDKFAESKGVHDCYRLEIQFVKDKANVFGQSMFQAMDKACDCESDSESAVVVISRYKSVLVGEVDFVDTSEYRDGSERPANWASRGIRCAWWQRIVSGIERARLVVSRSKPSLAKGVEWIRRQVFPFLAVVRTAYRHWSIPWNRWLLAEIDGGEDRWSDRHYQILEESLIGYPAV